MFSTNALACINFCNENTFYQVLNDSKSHDTAFDVRISPVEATILYLIIYTGTGHPFLSSCFSFLVPHLSQPTYCEGVKWALIA